MVFFTEALQTLTQQLTESSESDTLVMKGRDEKKIQFILYIR